MKIPGRVAVSLPTEAFGPTEVLYRCDDRNGFMLRVVQSGDGDFHLEVIADPDHEDVRTNCQYISGSVRVRIPIIGGGMHEVLWDALAVAFKAEIEKFRSQQKTS